MPKQSYPINSSSSHHMLPEEPSDEYQPVVTIPLNAVQVNSVEVDAEIEVTIKGKVVGLHIESDQEAYGVPGDARVVVQEIGVYPSTREIEDLTMNSDNYE